MARFNSQMRIVLISPPLVSLKGDILGSGVVYMPISLAYLASFLRAEQYKVQVIDGFGEAPFKEEYTKTHCIRGLTPEEIYKMIPGETKLIFLYAGNVTAHNQMLDIVRFICQKTAIPLIVFENTQAVTGYSLKAVAAEIMAAGATAIMTGEAEIRVNRLLKGLQNNDLSGVDGLVYRVGKRLVYNPKKLFNKNLDKLSFPAWELLPLNNYWSLGYSHGPLSAKRYLPILTSRGCPFCCAFCVASGTNNNRWRTRSAANVVDEMEHFLKKFNVREFHIEDLNPTIQKNRMINISKEIIARKLPITWKICAGTKIETLDKKTISWMADAGLAYLSFSPESGSKKVLNLMKKSFDADLALELAKHLHRSGVKTQACFVLGFPGETPKDRNLTEKYALCLAKAGVDEIALFIMTPVPGAEAYTWLRGFTELSQLTFSPRWRSDYTTIHKFRKRLYARFFLTKLLYHPIEIIQQLLNIVSRKFSTKTEMAVYRYLITHLRKL